VSVPGGTYSIVTWLSFLMNMALCGGFVLAVVLYAKRIGGAGPWFVAAIGVIDALLILVYRVHHMMGIGTSSIFEYDRNLTLIELGDAFLTVLSALVALVGFGLMMTPKRR
jgi:hypothetical protein